jgi:hypothetical protein
VHLGAREYDPETGAFTRRDPSGLEGGENQYAYAGGDPVNYWDPDGNFVAAVVVGAAAGAAVGGAEGAVFGAADEVMDQAFDPGRTGFDCGAIRAAAKRGAAAGAAAGAVAGAVGVAAAGPRRPTPGPGQRSPSQAGMSPGQANRIQNAANRTGQPIVVVGSRAAGTAGPGSDWDYIMYGNASQRHSASSSVPRGDGGGAYGSGIDVWNGYNPSHPSYTVLDPNRPHVIFWPR